MFDKTVFRVQSPENEDEREELSDSIKGFLGADSDNVLLLEDEIDPITGEIKKNGAFAIDKIESNVNADLFEKWERALQNNIRKSVGAVPEILIDYEAGKLGTTSGEAFKTAVDFYNSMTVDDRVEIENAFKEIFSNSVNPILKNNTNWKIKEVNLQQFEEQNASENDPILAKKLEAQSTLKGSVGGVQALLQIQQSVASGITSYNSGVTMLEEIFGFDTITAQKILNK
jgi:hypothetical protein